MNSCRLCCDYMVRNPDEYWNKPLFDFPNFVVLPSLGALVEGWLLLVPKDHFICMGALPESLTGEMLEIKSFLCSSVERTYRQVSVFEHGPSRSKLSIGCGVDHAHLHFVPIPFDLSSAVTQFLPKEILWSEAGLEECRDAYSRGEDYLYLEQPIGVGRIATCNGFGSQLFRRAIAAQMGVPDQFNWREYPQHSNILSTIDRVQVWGEV